METSIDMKRFQAVIAQALKELFSEQREVSHELVQKIFLNALKNYENQVSETPLPISWAEKPDVTALFDCRKDKPLNLTMIRKQAWKR